MLTSSCHKVKADDLGVRPMEIFMNRITQPDKEAVREWLKQRRTTSTPPPDNEQIRRELGWRLTGSMQRTQTN